MKVLILAGGLGTRIRGIFPDIPKSMIPFGGKPFLEYQIALLAAQGFHHYVLCVGHQATPIIDYFGDGSKLGVTITYSREPEPLGTGGAIRFAAAHIAPNGTFAPDGTPGPVLVLNGDTYLATDFRAVATAHAASPGAIGTVVVSEVEDTSRYGQVILDKARRITAFREKQEARGRGMVNAGAYVFSPRILDYIPPGSKVSLEREVFPALLEAGEPLYGCPIPETFIDFGTPEGYRHLERILSRRGFGVGSNGFSRP